MHFLQRQITSIDSGMEIGQIQDGRRMARLALSKVTTLKYKEYLSEIVFGQIINESEQQQNYDNYNDQAIVNERRIALSRKEQALAHLDITVYLKQHCANQRYHTNRTLFKKFIRSNSNLMCDSQLAFIKIVQFSCLICYDKIYDPNYYQKLMKGSLEHCKMFESSIEKDLQRTFSCQQYQQYQNQNNPNNIINNNSTSNEQKLKHILMAYSLRNPFVGYVQGMNFLVRSLLTNGFESESECFSIFMHLIESVLPVSYFTSSEGILIDQTILETMLEDSMPQLHALFQEHEFSLALVSINWLTCAFQTCPIISPPIQQIVLQNLFVFGSHILFKAAFAILKCKEQILLQTESFQEILSVLSSSQEDNLIIDTFLFQNHLQSVYVSKSLLTKTRELFHQRNVLDGKRIKMKRHQTVTQYQTSSAVEQGSAQLNLNVCSVFACAELVEKNKLTNNGVDFFVFKIPSYEMLILKNTVFDHFSFLPNSNANKCLEDDKIDLKQEIDQFDCMVGHMEHICKIHRTISTQHKKSDLQYSQEIVFAKKLKENSSPCFPDNVYWNHKQQDNLSEFYNYLNKHAKLTKQNSTSMLKIQKLQRGSNQLALQKLQKQNSPDLMLMMLQRKSQYANDLDDQSGNTKYSTINSVSEVVMPTQKGQIYDKTGTPSPSKNGTSLKSKPAAIQIIGNMSNKHLQQNFSSVHKEEGRSDDQPEPQTSKSKFRRMKSRSTYSPTQLDVSPFLGDSDQDNNEVANKNDDDLCKDRGKDRDQNAQQKQRTDQSDKFMYKNIQIDKQVMPLLLELSKMLYIVN